MNKRLSKILTIVSFVLAIIGLGLYYFSTDSGDSAMGNYVGYAMLLLIITAGLAIVFSLLNLFKNPGMLKKALVSLGVLTVVLVIAYLLADGDAVYNASNEVFPGSEGSVSKWVGTFINYSIILLFVGAVLFLYDMIKNLIK